MNKKIDIGGESPTNDAKNSIEFEQPYFIKAIIQGTADLLFHRWSNEDVLEKSRAKKGSKAKYSDNLESFVHRHPNGNLALLGEQFRMSIITSAKFKQDPRSKKKSAHDLYKAGIIVIDQYCDLGIKNWDYEDRRRAVVQKNAITRCRPALKAGWKCDITLQIILPEYILDSDVHELLSIAGRTSGVGDFRPTFGRFMISRFEKN